ncbi:MAG: hypothetical protein QOJ13_613 [Gaiellales bacterium]|jgi:hypothetical protein|nr:hypothetical protein [Gaiellales bacterium]
MALRTIGRLTLAAIGLLCVSATATAAGGSAPHANRDLPALTLPRHADALSRAVSTGQMSDAHAALLRAQALFQPAAVERRVGGTVAEPGPHDATMILRDLALRLRDLSGADRQKGEALVARPATDPAGTPGKWSTAEPLASPSCGTNVCVHWTTGGGDQPAVTDSDANNVPDWVDTTRDELENTVWATEVTTMGYRPPMDDLGSGDNGGNEKLDVYISNLGADSIYGYCTSDDPLLSDPTYKFWNFSAYCVVDNNYSEPIFHQLLPEENLKVTLAHEFFHAVQFAYDISEDAWLMEGTATWMEEQLYDAINDNRQYLVDGQGRQPSIPLDRGSGCCSQYAAWIWWEYLTQRLADTTYIRDVWERVNGSSTGPDQYSLQGARTALGARGFDIREWYGDFAVWNRIPSVTYTEGAAYPAPSASISHTLGPGKKATGWVQAKLNHLTSFYAALKPGPSASTKGHVTVRVDAPPVGWGSQARAIVFLKTGDVRVKPFALSSTGDGQLRLGFGRGVVTRVVVIMSNASQRYKCWQSTSVSCQGTPLDNNRPYAFRANLS